MTKPIVAIVGRPNVGKSTFFNRMVGKRISIVEDIPGSTRDRIYADVEWLNNKFILVDTGGIEPFSHDIILAQMRRQAELAIETADVILFFVDAKEGLIPSDEEVAELLRKAKKPIILIVNKVDTASNPDTFYDFYSLGLGEPLAISSSQGLGMGDMLDEIVKHFSSSFIDDEEDDVIKIAVVGKPNAGKSSIVNAILKEERVIVSEEPGTTRDAVDTPFTLEGEQYVIIDTAGIRRKSRIDDETIERYSVIRALAAIRRCDIALIVVDASEGMTEQDTKIAGYVHEEGKASIIIVNKWDLVEKETNTMDQYRKRIQEDLSFMSYVPSLFISAKTGQRVDKIIEQVKYVYEKTSFRISTGTLNDTLIDAMSITEPPSDKGRRLKIYYCTQVAVRPPTFVLFVNDPNLMHFSYQRYLENYLRKTFDLKGTPIKLIVRQKDK